MKISYTLLLVACVSFVQAQKILTRIPLQDIENKIGKIEVQGLTYGDSVFIADYSIKKKNDPAKAFWILPSGETVKLISSEFRNRLFVALDVSGDSTYFYYLESSHGDMLLKAVAQNRSTGAVTSLGKQIVFKGIFITIFQSGNISYLLSIEKAKNRIHLTEIKGMESLKYLAFTSPFDLDFGTSPYCFVPEHGTLSPAAAASKRKIYHQGDFLYLAIDKPQPKDRSAAWTALLKINIKTGATENRVVVDGSGNPFRTYIEKDFLFRISKSLSEGAVITIYNLHTLEPVRTMRINKVSTFAKNRAYKRNSADTFDKESVWDAVSNTSSGFITATSIDSTHYVVKLGAHHSEVKSGVPVITAFPVLAIVTAVAAIATTSEGPSIDQYFYLNWDTVNDPVFSDKPSGRQQTMDAYELSLFKEKRTFKYRGTIQCATRTLGLYKESGSTTLDIISF